MQISGIGKEGNNKFLYMGIELDETTSWYETDFRRYDPQLGRLTGIDALADQMSSATPYHYSFNNPIILNDPSGLSPEKNDTGSIDDPFYNRMNAKGQRPFNWDGPRYIESGGDNGKGDDGKGDDDPISTTEIDEIVITAKKGLWQRIKDFFSKSSGGVVNSMSKLPNYGGIKWHGRRGEGLGYTPRFTQGLRRIFQGLTRGSMYVGAGVALGPTLGMSIPYLVNGATHAYYKVGIEVLSVATKPGQAVFWTGATSTGVPMYKYSQQYVSQYGGVLLNSTRAGRFLEGAPKAISWNMSYWSRLSARFAQHASGNVRVLSGPSVNTGSVWMQTERFVLMNNTNVTNIEYIVK